MHRYFNKVSPVAEVSSSSVNEPPLLQPQELPIEDKDKVDLEDEPALLQSQELPNEDNDKVDLEKLPSDPGERPDIMSYPPNSIEQVRGAYLLRGPCQPRNHNFLSTSNGNRKRKFVSLWFDEFKPWLEYSVSKEVCYCLYCYLFLRLHGNGQDAFVSKGFTTWNKKERLRDHVGNHTSAHNRCRLACQDLMNQAQHIEVSISKQSTQSKLDYRCRLNATVVCLRYLIMQGMPSRGHDESEGSLNQGNFLELLKVISSCSDEISSVVLKNAPDNLKLTSPRIQKDIINAFAVETTKVIVQDMGNDFFSILVDECRDISVKEQMSVVVRYVDKNGCVMERFLGVVHVSDTIATSLEKALDSLLSTYDLSVSSLRGQGYDGASNMRGEFNGLKSLILRRNPSAYYVHCFSHQLQLTIVVVAKKHTSIGSFYNTVNRLCNVIESSCKRRDILREKQREKILERIASDEIHTGRGLNQEMALKRPGDTRWSSHYGTLINLMQLFSSISDVLVYVGENSREYPHRAEANDVSAIINLFEFVFVLHLMMQILGITHELSQVLQKKDQDIVNAMNLVKVAKARLQMLREEGWEGLLNEVFEFCNKYEINVLDMEDEFVPRGKANRRAEKRKNLHYYRVEIFCSVIDMQAQELNHRFGEINTDLLSCMACFDPRDSFSAFDLENLLRLTSYYPSEFSGVALKELENQLESFIFDVRIDENFSQVFGIGGLAKKMVSTRKHENFPLVYLLVKLSLILPVATASVERAFSAMKIIKSTLRNSMGDQLLHDCLVPYIEKDVFVYVSNETIMQRFQKMKNRREML